jgi:hypothetical protein
VLSGVSSRTLNDATFVRFFRDADDRQAALCAAQRAIALGFVSMTGTALRAGRVRGLDGGVHVLATDPDGLVPDANVTCTVS